MEDRMNTYAKLLEEEREFIKRREEELECHRALIPIYEKLARAEKSKVSEVPLPITSPAEETQASSGVPAKLNKDSKKILLALWSKAKTLDELQGFCNANDITISRNTLGARLNYYKRGFDFIETLKPGVYSLTVKAREYLKDKYPEDVANANEEVKELTLDATITQAEG